MESYKEAKITVSLRTSSMIICKMEDLAMMKIIKFRKSLPAIKSPKNSDKDLQSVVSSLTPGVKAVRILTIKFKTVVRGLKSNKLGLSSLGQLAV